MGLRVAVVVSTTSFLLGILFTHWIADSLTLWKVPITSDHIWTSASYYALFSRSPSEMGYVLAAVVTLGAATILWSLGDGAAGNLMFDGASIFLYGTAIAVYLYKILPSYIDVFSNIPARSPKPSNPFPLELKEEVLNLASANLVCSVALTGVLALQAARWWAERSDPEEETSDLYEGGVSRKRRQRRRKNSKLSRERASTTSTTPDSKRSAYPD